MFLRRYVGLCAFIKIVALVIFCIDWWLVKRRKHLAEGSPLSVHEVVGSIISLDKCMLNKFKRNRLLIFSNFAVFEEKAHIDNQNAPYVADLMAGDCGLNANFDSNKKVLYASRHLRNDSKGIQLELR